MAEELSGLIGDRYQIETCLGKGGMGVVYVVNDTVVGRRRALKTLLPKHGLDQGMRDRFEIERAALRAICHEAVVEVLDLGFDEKRGLPFLVMELLEGKDLKEILKHQRTLSPLATLKVLEQVALALDVIHVQGIVHRDLKPSNVFIQRRLNGLAQVKVLDFGIAKLLTSDEATTMAGGTPGFVAPEQLEGKGIGPHTDIYTFGKLARALLYGFHGDGACESVAFVAWLCIATAHEPERRFKSASQAVAELRRALRVEADSSSRYLEWAELEKTPAAIPGSVASVIGHPVTVEGRTEIAATVVLPRRESSLRQPVTWRLGLSAACVLAFIAWCSLPDRPLETPPVRGASAVKERQVVESPPVVKADEPAPVVTDGGTSETETADDEVTTREQPAEEVKEPAPKPVKRRRPPHPKPIDIY